MVLGGNVMAVAKCRETVDEIDVIGPVVGSDPVFQNQQLFCGGAAGEGAVRLPAACGDGGDPRSV